MKNKKPVTKISASVLVTIGVIILSYLLLPKVHSVGASKSADVAAIKAADKRARMALGGLPLTFEMNRGQFDAQVQFASRGAGYKAFFTQTEAVFVLRKPAARANANPSLMSSKTTNAERSALAQREREERAAERAASKAVVRMSLAGANPAPQVTGTQELPGKINYFRGNDQQKWITDVPTFRRVSYTGVYPGIDLIYYGQGRQLEYDLVVAPGADPSQIAFIFDGAERLEVDAATGALVVTAAGGAQLRQGKPLLYQEVDGAKRAVSGGFITNGNGTRFSIGDYDRSRPLVIDPAIINYSTYLGGESNDRVHGIAADADGNAYAVGWTESETFPVKNGYQAGQNNDSDQAFITKFNADGSELIWSTYLGGSGQQSKATAGDGAYGVALDADHNVYVTGFAFSFDFPMRNALQPQQSDGGCCFNSDSFITKINAAGNELVFSTYFGGADGNDAGRGIAVDRHNNVYVVGYTDSFAFPTTNPIQGEIDGRIEHFHNFQESNDGYLAKIDASGQFRVYSTYIGGPSNDVALGVAVDFEGAAYVTGWTDSTQPEPVASPSPSPSPGDGPDPDPTPTPTPSATPAIHFPITDNAFQKDPGGVGLTRDAFVTKVDPAGSQYIYSTYLGGDGVDIAWSIALGLDHSAIVGGYTSSGLPSGGQAGPIQNEFPITANAFQSQNNGGFDAFLTRISPDGSGLIYSTYIGGDANEGDSSDACLSCADRIDGAAVAVDILGNAYITGWTESTFVPSPPSPNGPSGATLNFPTKDAFQAVIREVRLPIRATLSFACSTPTRAATIPWFTRRFSVAAGRTKARPSRSTRLEMFLSEAGPKRTRLMALPPHRGRTIFRRRPERSRKNRAPGTTDLSWLWSDDRPS
jgi:hypothetical protein